MTQQHGFGHTRNEIVQVPHGIAFFAFVGSSCVRRVVHGVVETMRMDVIATEQLFQVRRMQRASGEIPDTELRQRGALLFGQRLTDNEPLLAGHAIDGMCASTAVLHQFWNPSWHTQPVQHQPLSVHNRGRTCDTSQQIKHARVSHTQTRGSHPHGLRRAFLLLADSTSHTPDVAALLDPTDGVHGDEVAPSWTHLELVDFSVVDMSSAIELPVPQVELLEDMNGRDTLIL